MDPPTACLLDLPAPLLAHVLGFLRPSKQDLANMRLVCKALQDMALSDFYMSQYKLQRARRSGLEGRLVTFLARTSGQWRHVRLEADCGADVRHLIRSLNSAHGGSNSSRSLHSLTFYADPPWIEQQGFHALASLTALSLCDAGNGTPMAASDLVGLSSLTALQALAVSGTLSGSLAFPAEALLSLQQLTSLDLRAHHVPLDVSDEEADGPGAPVDYEQCYLSVRGEHLAACTALRSLSLERVELLGQAPTAWQGLERLSICSVRQEAGFWSALPHLPCLTSLAAGQLSLQVERSVYCYLPTCYGLVSLQLWECQSDALPQLPPSLTKLQVSRGNIWRTALAPRSFLRTAPFAPCLRRLELTQCWSLTHWPDSMAAMRQLTALHISRCRLQELPAPLAALPALEVLALIDCYLRALPAQLACVGSLRKLALCDNMLRGVPAVLGGGAASRLQRLYLANNPLLVEDEGFEMLRSLTALEYLDITQTGNWDVLEELAEKVRDVLPEVSRVVWDWDDAEELSDDSEVFWHDSEVFW